MASKPKATTFAGESSPQESSRYRARAQVKDYDAVVEELDGATLPDVKNVSDLARMQLADMLSAVDGKKDLVIQPELMSLLDNVTPMKFLRK